MELSSEAFEDGGNIPSKFTCDGKDVSPPLSLSEIPGAAASLALVVDDPDAPGGVFDHWVIWNISPDVGSIPEGVTADKSVESLGANQGRNDFGEIGYRGPCPPPGPAHRYRFKLYALDDKLDLEPGSTKRELESAMEEHIVAEADLIGNYGR